MASFYKNILIPNCYCCDLCQFIGGSGQKLTPCEEGCQYEDYTKCHHMFLHHIIISVCKYNH